MSSPTSRTLAQLRKDGYYTAIVEHFNYYTKRSHDLFGCIDVLAIKEGETLAIQCTSRSNVSARVKKITEDRKESLEWMLAANWKVQVWGFGKMASGKVELRIVSLNPEKVPDGLEA